MDKYIKFAKQRNDNSYALADFAIRSTPYFKEANYEQAIINLIADLMHLCHREKIDMGNILSIASKNFEEEIREVAA